MKKHGAVTRKARFLLMICVGMFCILCGCSKPEPEDPLKEMQDYFSKIRALETTAMPYGIAVKELEDGFQYEVPTYLDEPMGELPLTVAHCATSRGILLGNKNILFLLTNDALTYMLRLSGAENIQEIPFADSKVVYFRASGEDEYDKYKTNYIYRFYMDKAGMDKALVRVLDLNSETFRNILTAYQGVVTHWQAINNRELIFVIEPMADVPEDSDAYRTFLEQERERLKDNEKARQLLDAMLHGDGEVVYRPMIVYDTETRKMKTLYTQGEQKTYIESVSNILWNPVQE